MDDELIYLSSLDSLRLAPVRSCRITGALSFDTGKPARVATIDPPIAGQDLDRVDDISTVVLSARHAGSDITNLTEFPCFVHVAVAADESRPLTSPIRSDDLVIIGWGELYRSASDAEHHRFDAGGQT